MYYRYTHYIHICLYTHINKHFYVYNTSIKPSRKYSRERLSQYGYRWQGLEDPGSLRNVVGTPSNRFTSTHSMPIAKAYVFMYIGVYECICLYILIHVNVFILMYLFIYVCLYILIYTESVDTIVSQMTTTEQLVHEISPYLYQNIHYYM